MLPLAVVLSVSQAQDDTHPSFLDVPQPTTSREVAMLDRLRHHALLDEVGPLRRVDLSRLDRLGWEPSEALLALASSAPPETRGALFDQAAANAGEDRARIAMARAWLDASGDNASRWAAALAAWAAVNGTREQILSAWLEAGDSLLPALDALQVSSPESLTAVLEARFPGRTPTPQAITEHWELLRTQLDWVDAPPPESDDVDLIDLPLTLAFCPDCAGSDPQGIGILPTRYRAPSTQRPKKGGRSTGSVFGTLNGVGPVLNCGDLDDVLRSVDLERLGRATPLCPGRPLAGQLASSKGPLIQVVFLPVGRSRGPASGSSSTTLPLRLDELDEILPAWMHNTPSTLPARLTSSGFVPDMTVLDTPRRSGGQWEAGYKLRHIHLTGVMQDRSGPAHLYGETDFKVEVWVEDGMPMMNVNVADTRTLSSFPPELLSTITWLFRIDLVPGSFQADERDADERDERLAARLRNVLSADLRDAALSRFGR